MQTITKHLLKLYQPITINSFSSVQKAFDSMNYGYNHLKEISLNFVRSMKLGSNPATYQKEAGGGESFYGSYHALPDCS